MGWQTEVRGGLERAPVGLACPVESARGVGWVALVACTFFFVGAEGETKGELPISGRYATVAEQDRRID